VLLLLPSNALDASCAPLWQHNPPFDFFSLSFHYPPITYFTYRFGAVTAISTAAFHVSLVQNVCSNGVQLGNE
jgi:hypothetical protein